MEKSGEMALCVGATYWGLGLPCDGSNNSGEKCLWLLFQRGFHLIKADSMFNSRSMRG